MMLAPNHLPPRPSYPQPAHEHIVLSTMAASLAISSPILCPPHSLLSSTASTSPLRPNRPKLTLNTAQTRSLTGKNSSLRLETLSATSPTIRNTFINGNEPAAQATFAPGSARPSKPRLTIDSSISSLPPVADTNTDGQGGFSTLSSASTPSTTTTTSSASSTDSGLLQIPYKLAHNVKSILSNSPLPKRTPISSFAMSRPMFPAQKRVSFRAPLEEEIHTVRYTMAHSDIEMNDSEISLASSDETSTSSNLSEHECEAQTSSTESGSLIASTSSGSDSQGSLPSLADSGSSSASCFSTTASEDLPPVPTSPAHSATASDHSDAPSLSLSTSSAASASYDEPHPHQESQRETQLRDHRQRLARFAKLPRSSSSTTGTKRDSSSENDDSDSCPETPVAGRRKKKRVWIWTLDPADHDDSLSPPSSSTFVN